MSERKQSILDIVREAESRLEDIRSRRLADTRRWLKNLMAEKKGAPKDA